MKKNILLLRFRKNKVIAEREKKCIKRTLKNVAEITTVNIFLTKKKLSSGMFSRIDGIIMGGSGEFNFSRKSDHADLWTKIDSLTPLLKSAVNKKVPILGICLGHQYLAHIFGLQIIRDPKQKEVGTYEINLTKAGKNNFLFQGLPEKFLAQQGHYDSIKKLSDKFILLASGDKCGIESFQVKGECVFGVQFHPEMDIKDSQERLKLSPGYNPNKTKIKFKPSPLAKKVLLNFVKSIK